MKTFNQELVKKYTTRNNNQGQLHVALGEDIEEVITFLNDLGVSISTKGLDKRYPVVINTKERKAFSLGTNALLACVYHCGGKLINIKTLKSLVIDVE